MATVWELAKSGRKGDPPGLTKPEFERAACLVSFGVHESASALRKRNSSSGGAFLSGGTDADKKHAKRLRYARAGMFWKFEAFDVRPKQSVAANPRDQGAPVPPDAPSLSAARPLVAPITLDVPVSIDRGIARKNRVNHHQPGAPLRVHASAEDAFPFSSDDEDAEADLGGSARDARFPADASSAEVARRTSDSPRPHDDAETARTDGSAPPGNSTTIDPFADLVAAISADPRSFSGEASQSRSNGARRGPFVATPTYENRRAPHLLDEFPGAPPVSFDVNRLSLADRPPEDPHPPREGFAADREKDVSPTPTPALSAPSPAFDPASAFETPHSPETFAVDFSGHAFEPTTRAPTKQTEDEAEAEDDSDDAFVRRADDAREAPEPDPTPFRDAFSESFFDDDGVGPSARAPPRPARDPEMEEWSAACRAWPWLVDEARTEERRDEGETEAETGWAAF